MPGAPTGLTKFGKEFTSCRRSRMSSIRNWYRIGSESLRDVIRPPKGGKVYPGINLSDRADDWEQNYRCPDVAVFLPGNLAEKFKAHYRGPADFLVEVVSPHDDTPEKIPFYGVLACASCSSSIVIPGRWNSIGTMAANLSWRPDRAWSGATLSPALSCRSVSNSCRPSRVRRFALRKLAARGNGPCETYLVANVHTCRNWSRASDRGSPKNRDRKQRR